MSRRKILMVGATGHLGSQVVEHLVAQGHQVRALVRKTSRTAHLQEAGIELVIGDMLEPDSLVQAMRDIHTVVVTASGHRRREAKDRGSTDLEGIGNIALAAQSSSIARVVLTGVVRSEVAVDVHHFHTKFLAEELLRSYKVPFVSIRAGGFLDQSDDFLLKAVTDGKVMWFGAAKIPMTWILTEDLARYIAAAVDLENPKETIEVGWSRNINITEFGDIASNLLGRKLSRWIVPWPVASLFLSTAGIFNERTREDKAMFRFFQSGDFILNNSNGHETAFGALPTPEQAIARWLRAGGLLPEENNAGASL